ncbi:hypothetical protein DVH05_014135 [Phytophthora capsici]|nr:hypothetical protein DVH05_018112 [Phytophthora capsici]KAG1699218.1 hypothetical protein DVH05_014135 [Phytophthora capsici]
MTLILAHESNGICSRTVRSRKFITDKRSGKQWPRRLRVNADSGLPWTEAVSQGAVYALWPLFGLRPREEPAPKLLDITSLALGDCQVSNRNAFWHKLFQTSTIRIQLPACDSERVRCSLKMTADSTRTWQIATRQPSSQSVKSTAVMVIAYGWLRIMSGVESKKPQNCLELGLRYQITTPIPSDALMQQSNRNSLVTPLAVTPAIALALTHTVNSQRV